MRALLASRLSAARDAPVPARGLLQRKCACGGGGGSACTCEHHNDEEDARETTLQRAAQADGGMSGRAAPPVVRDVLHSPGSALPVETRGTMESRLGHDFGAVRVHADGRAAESARAVAARAYTVGHHVVFGANQYAPQTEQGSRLLAHELTHVQQQAGEVPAGEAIMISASDSVAEREAEREERGSEHGDAVPARGQQPHLARKDDKPGKGDKPKPDKPAPLWQEGKTKTGKGCGDKAESTERESRINSDFPNTHIEQITIEIGKYEGLTLKWTDTPMAARLPTGPFKISAGAGKCCVDCNKGGQFCTPWGLFHAMSVAPHLAPPHDWACDPVFFKPGGFAIHSGGLPTRPHSHGCVRTEPRASAVIHDNVIYGGEPRKGRKDRRTSIEIKEPGSWSTPWCYDTLEQNKPFERKKVCEDGKRKKEEEKPKAKAEEKPKEKTQAKTPEQSKGKAKEQPKKETTKKKRKAALFEPSLPFATGTDLESEDEQIALLEESDLKVEEETDWPGPAGP